MRSSNKLGLVFGLTVAACGSAYYAGGLRLSAPARAETKQSVTPQAYPQGNQPTPPQSPAPAASAQDGPPPATGPSATSDTTPDRYDEVGYATWYGDELSGSSTASGAKFDPAGFTAAHRTLPLGSFVEVTALDSGKTILVEVNDRGPTDRGLLIDLSRGAANALGMPGRGAVRVRRVTPSPDDYATMRAGRPGAPRLDTPPALLAGLKQRLASVPAPAMPRLAKPVLTDTAPKLAQPRPAAPAAPVPVRPAAPTQPRVASGKGYFVQVAAFSTQARADGVARAMGGGVQPLGKLWRVRLGPYASAGQAAQARDGAARRGYGDARVIRED